jgi:hypothetical protein
MSTVLVVAVWICALTQVQLGEQLERSTRRQTQFEQLSSEYEAAIKEHHAQKVPNVSENEQQIERYQDWPGWQYLPKFLALAEENPTDETALHCCRWIFDRCANVGNSERVIYEADSAAWRIVTKHQTQCEELPLLCLRAVQYPTAAREQFLRSLPDDYRQPVDVHGYAFLALAELLTHRYKIAANGGPNKWPAPISNFEEHSQREISLDWKEYMNVADPEALRKEACDLFRHVLAHYADIPISVSEPSFRDFKTLGEKAAKSLHALEHLRVAKEGAFLSEK